MSIDSVLDVVFNQPQHKVDSISNLLVAEMKSRGIEVLDENVYDRLYQIEPRIQNELVKQIQKKIKVSIHA